ncbi:MAG TPA: ferritin-like domain-containing protein [Gaiellaceae bacterium]|nr:ferritin-like domain-containing protein [Gaiellaceae bacterium]
MELNSLNDVFEEQLGDLYDAEKQLVTALPKITSAAHSDELRKALQTHLEETRGHVERLEQIFGDLGMPTPTEHCQAMAGLIQEGDQVVEATGDPVAKDAALIAAAQRVEHYEISGYGTARTLARELGHDDAASLLDKTLDEESNADTLLTKVATGGMLRSGINQEAAGKR